MASKQSARSAPFDCLASSPCSTVLVQSIEPSAFKALSSSGQLPAVLLLEMRVTFVRWHRLGGAHVCAGPGQAPCDLCCCCVGAGRASSSRTSQQRRGPTCLLRRRSVPSRRMRVLKSTLKFCSHFCLRLSLMHNFRNTAVHHVHNPQRLVHLTTAMDQTRFSKRPFRVFTSPAECDRVEASVVGPSLQVSWILRNRRAPLFFR